MKSIIVFTASLLLVLTIQAAQTDAVPTGKLQYPAAANFDEDDEE